MQALTDRLATVATLHGRIFGAARFAQVLASNQLPQVCPAAFVLPLGLRGGAATAVTGLFRQSLDRLVGVVLVVRNVADATGAAAYAELEPLVEAVISAVAGWSPDADALGTFVLTRGELVSVAAGTITYQLDFAIEDQLRIAR